MSMKNWILGLLAAFLLGGVVTSCNDDKTYAEMKEDEKEAIQRFIEREKIEVITEEEFEAQDSVTDLAKNQYVLLKESGVYMQIVKRGEGKPLKDGRHEVLARYVEERIGLEKNDTISFNNDPSIPGMAHPDVLTLTKKEDSYSAMFKSGMMPTAWQSPSVPTGWIVPFNYIRVGREIAGRSKVRLIVPHNQGQMNASQYVYPCYYEIIYQLAQ